MTFLLSLESQQHRLFTIGNKSKYFYRLISSAVRAFKTRVLLASLLDRRQLFPNFVFLFADFERQYFASDIKIIILTYVKYPRFFNARISNNKDCRNVFVSPTIFIYKFKRIPPTDLELYLHFFTLSSSVILVKRRATLFMCVRVCRSKGLIKRDKSVQLQIV